MKNLNVEHFLNIYSLRKRMQNEGVTNPSKKAKEFTKTFVEKLATMPMDEEITIENNSFYDSKKNLTIEIPTIKEVNYLKIKQTNERKADYSFECLDRSLLLDFNISNENLVFLIRITFAKYGCCDFEENSKPLNIEDSEAFLQFINFNELYQNIIHSYIKKAVIINKENIWLEALNESELLDI